MDTVLYPLAVVDMEVEGIPVRVEAAVVDTLHSTGDRRVRVASAAWQMG